MALTRIANIASTIPDDSVANVKMANIVQSKNILINGDMSIAQRGTSTASITTTGYHTLDRWNTTISALGTWTQSQDTDVPTGQGFATSLKMDNTTADASPGASDYLNIRQYIEGQNLQYLKKGTANAESLTVSFWVKATKTGTNIVSLRDNDNTRQISKSYTIDSTDTWEQKEITFAGDTTGAFDNDNAASLTVLFWLAAGSNYTSGTLNTSWGTSTDANRAVGQVNHADSTSNNIWITGIQMEAGSVATDFEVVSYGQNLERCERYFNRPINGSGQGICTAGAYNSNDAFGIYIFPVKMRTTPSIETTSGTSYYNFIGNNTGTSFDGPLVLSTGTESSAQIAFSSFAGALTQGVAGAFRSANASSSVAFSAEL